MRDARRYPIKVRIRALAMDDLDAGSTSVVPVVASSALGDEKSIDMLLGMDALLRYRSVTLANRVCVIDDALRLELP